MCFIYARIYENGPSGKTQTQAFIRSGAEFITFWPVAIFMIVSLFLETYEQTYEVEVSLTWPFCEGKYLVWKWRCALIGVIMVLFVPLMHMWVSSHAHSICITSTCLIIICTTSHIHVAVRSRNMSSDQKQFISDYIYPHALDDCYYHCLCVVMTLFCFCHILHRRMGAWNVWEVTLFHIKIIRVCDWYDGMNCVLEKC